ncbi:ankyrin repeat domain-containing protein [Candidatus Berkiella aquae]|uniref:Ankyrin repeat domain-containing protein n=1 Tax=Candidatus Berkiella aquae TaxID=295108 RepID=A0A0Q9YIX1_9GAMM|nr:ankyrin repeat domain-containing protein [Candidatus Berkiella aquae]MCS5710206.1 ankyrin repeat domain-containing protein [Candidatus Berkiella aquae]
MAKQGPGIDEDYQALIVLMKALQLRDETVAGQVLTVKPQVRQKCMNQSQTTALMGAVKYNCSEEIFRELIQAPSNINAQDKAGWAVIHLIAKYNRCDLLSILLEQKEVNFNITTAKGESALAIAASCGNDQIIAMLLEKGADYLLADSFEQEQRLPIHLACFAGSLACVQLLLEKEPLLISAVDRVGRTLAHYLAQSDCNNEEEKKAIAALFSGQQLAQESDDGATPVETASYFEHHTIADTMASGQLLSLYQICLNKVCKTDNQSLAKVLEQLPTDIAEKLLDKRSRMDISFK